MNKRLIVKLAGSVLLVEAESSNVVSTAILFITRKPIRRILVK